MLGDAVVDAALAPLRQKLADLQAQTPANDEPAGPPQAAEAVLEWTGTGAEALPESAPETRKLITVLFADLVDFTALSEQMDPEDVREVLREYFTVWTRCIESFGGVIEKFIGDAVMAVFGLRTAREDDSRRAVHAALCMREVLADLNRRFEQEHGLRLSMRVGIHTGQALVSLLSERRGQDFVVVGDTVNLASRLQSAAPPNNVLISHDTFRLVRGDFDIQALEPVQVKGKREPVRVYLVLAAKPRSLRLEHTTSEFPLVGRERETGVMIDFLQRAFAASRQHSLLITGEAGMGKSRIIEELETQLELLPLRIRYFKGRASPYFQQQSFALLRDLIANRLDIQDSDSPETARQKLEAGMGQAAAQPVGRLLGMIDSPGPSGGSLSGGAQAASSGREIRDRALEALVRFFQSIAAQQPVAVVLEDLEWADSSSLEMITAVQRELARLPLNQSIVWVATARPEFASRAGAGLYGQPLPDRDPPTRLEIGPLSEPDSLRLLKALLAQAHPAPDAVTDEPPGEVVQLIIHSAEGNPLYIEELLRMLIEDGVILPVETGWQAQPEQLAAVRVPPTLTEFIQSRLDSLPAEERAILQRAAVVGRVFWDQAVDYLQTGAPVRQGQASRVLSGLSQASDVGSGIVLQRDVSQFEEAREYVFSHSLFRDVTYESLLKRQRRIYHAHAAHWLESITESSQRGSEFAAMIAEHYALAEENEPAARWYRRAGIQASRRYGNIEAAHNLSRALELLPEDDLEGRYQLTLEREKVYNRLINRPAQSADLDRLESIANTLDDDYKRAEVSLRRADYHFFHNQYALSIDFARRAAALAVPAGEQRQAAEGHVAWGRALFWDSQNDEAQAELETALAIARQADLPDIEATSLWNLGVLASNLSDYARSQALLSESLDLFRKLGDREGEGLAIAQLGNIAHNLGDYTSAREMWETARDVFHWTGHRLREATLLNNLGAVHFNLANYHEARQAQSEALLIYREAGDRNGHAVTLINLGGVLREEGRLDEARESFQQASQIIEEIHDRYIETPLRADQSLLHIYRGEIADAIAYAETAVKLAEEVQTPYYGAFARGRLAQAYLFSGRLEEAGQAYTEAAEIYQQLGMDLNVLEMQLGQARVRLALGDLPGAQQWMSAMLAYVEEHRDLSELNSIDEPARALLSLFQILQAAGDPRAPALARRARGWLQERAARIQDPDTRRTYFENVPTNREINALLP